MSASKSTSNREWSFVSEDPGSARRGRDWPFRSWQPYMPVIQEHSVPSEQATIGNAIDTNNPSGQPGYLGPNFGLFENFPGPHHAVRSNVNDMHAMAYDPFQIVGAPQVLLPNPVSEEGLRSLNTQGGHPQYGILPQGVGGGQHHIVNMAGQSFAPQQASHQLPTSAFNGASGSQGPPPMNNVPQQQPLFTGVVIFQGQVEGIDASLSSSDQSAALLAALAEAFANMSRNPGAANVQYFNAGPAPTA